MRDARLRRGDALADRQVVGAVPLPHDSAARDVDLLHDRLEDAAVARAADGAQVRSALGVHRHVGGAARGELELVVVAHVAVARSHHRDRSVVAVEDHVLAHAVAPSRAALPPRQHRLASVALHAEAGRRHVRRDAVEPHDVAPVVDDLRPVLPRAALDGEEHVAGCGAAARRHDDSDAVGVEPRARVEAQHVGGARDLLAGAAAAAQQQPGAGAGGDEEERGGGREPCAAPAGQPVAAALERRRPRSATHPAEVWRVHLRRI